MIDWRTGSARNQQDLRPAIVIKGKDGKVLKVARGGEMRAVKFVQRRAVAGRALREKQHRAAHKHSPRHRRVGGGDRPPPLAIHENGFLQSREIGDDRPRFDFTLGEKAGGLETAKHHYVEPRNMVGDNKTWPLRRRDALRENMKGQ